MEEKKDDIEKRLSGIENGIFILAALILFTTIVLGWNAWKVEESLYKINAHNAQSLHTIKHHLNVE